MHGVWTFVYSPGRQGLKASLTERRAVPLCSRSVYLLGRSEQGNDIQAGLVQPRPARSTAPAGTLPIFWLDIELGVIVAQWFFALYARADSGFASNCTQFSLCGTVLRATCLNDAGRAHKTSIDLDACLSFWPDHNGYIWCQQDGTLGGCDQCALNGTTVWCPCPGDGEVWNHFNPFDLDTCIGNKNGKLIIHARIPSSSATGTFEGHGAAR